MTPAQLHTHHSWTHHIIHRRDLVTLATMTTKIEIYTLHATLESFNLHKPTPVPRGPWFDIINHCRSYRSKQARRKNNPRTLTEAEAYDHCRSVALSPPLTADASAAIAPAPTTLEEMFGELQLENARLKRQLTSAHQHFLDCERLRAEIRTLRSAATPRSPPPRPPLPSAPAPPSTPPPPPQPAARATRRKSSNPSSAKLNRLEPQTPEWREQRAKLPQPDVFLVSVPGAKPAAKWSGGSYTVAGDTRSPIKLRKRGRRKQR